MEIPIQVYTGQIRDTVAPRPLWKRGEVQAQMTVVFGAGQMYALGRCRNLEWKSRLVDWISNRKWWTRTGILPGIKRKS